jgi:hypothetical protein
MLLTLLGFALICAAGWGSNSALLEVAKRRPLEPLHTEQNRFEVDPYIWSGQAPPALRRRYIITSAFFPLGAALMGFGAWQSGDPRGHTWGALALAGACFVACALAWKIIRTRWGLSRHTAQSSREAVMKTSGWLNWHEVLEPREAVIAGVVGL